MYVISSVGIVGACGYGFEELWMFRRKTRWQFTVPFFIQLHITLESFERSIDYGA